MPSSFIPHTYILQFMYVAIHVFPALYFVYYSFSYPYTIGLSSSQTNKQHTSHLFILRHPPHRLTPLPFSTNLNTSQHTIHPSISRSLHSSQRRRSQNCVQDHFLPRKKIERIIYISSCMHTTPALLLNIVRSFVREMNPTLPTYIAT